MQREIDETLEFVEAMVGSVEPGVERGEHRSAYALRVQSGPKCGVDDRLRSGALAPTVTNAVTKVVGRSSITDREAAVDDEDRTGDVRGGREQQRQRRVRDLFGIPVAT
jgi:hypothetical protein